MSYSPALEGIVVGETSISDVDGAAGRLSYRGTSIEQLVDQPQWQVAAALACEQPLDDAQLDAFYTFMRFHSALAPADLELLKAMNPELHPMLMLQAAMPCIAPVNGPALSLPLSSERIDHGYALAAKIPALLAFWRSHQLGRHAEHTLFTDAVEQQDPLLRFLQLFPGAAQAEDELLEQARVLNAAQVLQLEHSFNCSTFAGRVCASTNAPIESVLSVSIGTLFGPLHGGADQAALETALEVGSPERAADYVRDCLANKVKIMGMGHREYSTVDPRAKVLKPMAEGLCKGTPQQVVFETLVAIEDACRAEFAERDKEIWANVEFYKGAVFSALGIPSDYFTALFAMARVFGYLAHYEEFRQSPRLIRPQARYIGR